MLSLNKALLSTSRSTNAIVSSRAAVEPRLHFRQSGELPVVSTKRRKIVIIRSSVVRN